MASPAKIDAGLCERLISAATSHCSATSAQIQQPPAVPQTSNFDGLAASFAALSAALTWGALVIAAIAFLAAIGWWQLVKHRSKEEAKTQVGLCAKQHIDDYMDKWTSEIAPKVIRSHVEYLMNASIGDDDDYKAADDMGKEAG